MDTATMHDTLAGRLTLFDEKVFRVFVPVGDVVEVRILGAFGKSSAWEGYAKGAKGAVSGYFDDLTVFCKAVQEADKTIHGGIYFTLHKIDPRLIGRSFNRLKPSDFTTSDKDVLVYRWLPVDLDPVRPSRISSSDSELQAALELREVVCEWIVSNLDLPAPVKAMSGNGGHLLFRLPELPVTEKSKTFIQKTLEGLAHRFDTDRVKIDTGVFNPARIWKLYGTTARKGDAVPEGPQRAARPHRMAYIDDMGNML